MKPLVSIVIAMKNGENTIVDMLNSIQRQTYENIEIIIAYDTKSIDDGLFVVKNFDSKFPITVLEGEDTSIGNARNRGLKVAKGEFVWFCDADDELLPTSCESLVTPMLDYSNIHVSCGNWYTNRTNNKTQEKNAYNKIAYQNNKKGKVDLIKAVDAMHMIWLKRNLPIASWGWMFRHSYINELGLEYPDYSHGEDQIFVLTALKNTYMIAKTDVCVYFYKVHPYSVSNKPRDSDEFWVQHEQYRNDYFKLVGNDYPSVESIAYMDYMRWFIYELSAKPKQEYYRVLQRYGIKVIPFVNKGEIIHAGACLLFNISPELARKCARLLRKIRGEPVW